MASSANSIRLPPVPDLIALKRDGNELRQEHIQHFIDGLMRKDVHDSQLGAMLMAMYLKGLNKKEVIALTESMLNSGEKLMWPKEWSDDLVDKHSTGGVGDKVSLILAPALAACGMKVPMISGRSLGFTGGTLDKLESIKGFRTDLSPSEIKTALETVGCCIVAQTETLVPADKLMYAVRDTTSTVASVPLIVSSIISKKAAEGIKALVLDVKCGKGAFAKSRDFAEKLAHALVAVSEGLGMRTSAFITEMDNPIGRCIGNSLEVAESIECLQGKGPKDLEELVCILGGELLHLSKKVQTVDEGRKQILNSLINNSAFEKFMKMLEVQKVPAEVINHLCNPQNCIYGILPLSKNKTELKVKCSGVISHIDSLKCAEVTAMLGAGRTRPGDTVAFDVGLQLLVSVGQCVKQNDGWAIVFHKEETLEKSFVEQLSKAINVTEEINKNDIMKTRLISKVSIDDVSEEVAFTI